jgi:mRNA interferase MazF
MTAMMQSRTRAKRGDIVLVLFPHAGLRTAKRRPALVAQADHLHTGVAQLIVAMITSNLQRAGHPSRRLITVSTDEGRFSGLLTDSVVMTDNLATIAHSTIHRIIGTMPMEDIDAALRHTLGL